VTDWPPTDGADGGSLAGRLGVGVSGVAGPRSRCTTGEGNGCAAGASNDDRTGSTGDAAGAGGAGGAGAAPVR
jgi:hypothetical protein